MPFNSYVFQPFLLLGIVTSIIFACSQAKTKAETMTPKITAIARSAIIVTAPTRRPTKMSFLGTLPNRRKLPHSKVFSATTNITPISAARGIISIH